MALKPNVYKHIWFSSKDSLSKFPENWLFFSIIAMKSYVFCEAVTNLFKKLLSRVYIPENSFIFVKIKSFSLNSLKILKTEILLMGAV